MAGGRFKAVREVQVGDTLSSGAVALATIQSEVAGLIPMVCLSGAWITSEHPVRHDGCWVLPPTLGAVVMRDPAVLYNFVLDRDHVIVVNGVESCTLAHGSAEPGLAHEFWGTERCLQLLRVRPDWPAVCMSRMEDSSSTNHEHQARAGHRRLGDRCSHGHTLEAF